MTMPRKKKLTKTEEIKQKKEKIQMIVDALKMVEKGKINPIWLQTQPHKKNTLNFFISTLISLRFIEKGRRSNPGAKLTFVLTDSGQKFLEKHSNNEKITERGRVKE
jgi:predicted transcriptional regulator